MKPLIIVSSLIILLAFCVLKFTNSHDHSNDSPSRAAIPHIHFPDPDLHSDQSISVATKSTDEEFQILFDKCETSSKALRLVLAEVEYAEAGLFRVSPEILSSACERVVAKWPNSDEAIESELTLSHIFLRMEQRGKFVAAIVRYLQAIAISTDSTIGEIPSAERKKLVEERTMAALLLECDRLFARGQTTASFDCLMIVTADYKGSESADLAKIKMSKCFYKMNRTNEAIACLRSVIDGGAQGEILLNAFKDSADIYINTGRTGLALDVYEELLNHSCDPEDYGYVVFHRGLTAYCKGIKSYSEAADCFETVIRECPEHEYAENSQQMLDIIHQENAIKPPAPPKTISTEFINKNRSEKTHAQSF